MLLCSSLRLRPDPSPCYVSPHFHFVAGINFKEGLDYFNVFYA